jgi:hypothetical protein
MKTYQTLLIVLLFLAGLSYQTVAQSTEFGVKAGATLSKFEKDINSNYTPGFSLGAYKEWRNQWLGIQPELLYHYQALKKVYGPFGENLRIHNLSLPVGLNFHTNEHLSLHVGQQLSYLFASNDNYSTTVFYDANYADDVPPEWCSLDPTGNYKPGDHLNKLVGEFFVGFKGNMTNGFHISGRFHWGYHNISKVEGVNIERKYFTLLLGKKF